MNKETYIIEINNLFKRFLIGTKERLTLFQTIRYKLSGETPEKEIWALKNINLKIYKGEMISIIGPNGSGKSTLLKIIAGILKPTFGTVKVQGNISTIFELGLGFIPRFTAEENVYIYGALHGITKKEMVKKLDSIFEFAELEDFRGAKLSDFSSGMRIRLAFATIIQTVKDIILVDEVLTVGDTAFQNKCLKVFEKLIEKGHTILFVTHSIGDAKKICNKTLYLNKGEQIGFGSCEEIEKLYEKNIEEKNQQLNEFNYENIIKLKNDFTIKEETEKEFDFSFSYIKESLKEIINKTKENLKSKDFLFALAGFILPFMIISVSLFIDYYPIMKQKIREKNQQKLFNQAIEFKNQGDLDLAEEKLRKIIEIEPNHFHAHFILFEIYLEKQNYTESQEVANKITQHIQPNNLETIKNIAGIYYEKNQFNLALDFYLKMLSLAKEQENNEEMKNSYLGITRCYVELGDKKTSKKYASEARRLFPELKNISDELLFQVKYSE